MSRSVVSDQKKGRVAESGGGDAARASSHSITPDWLSRQLRQFRALLSAVSQRRLCTRERRIERGVCVSAESCPSASPPPPPSLPLLPPHDREVSRVHFLPSWPLSLSHALTCHAATLLLSCSFYFALRLSISTVSLNRHRHRHRHPPIGAEPPPTSASPEVTCMCHLRL